MKEGLSAGLQYSSFLDIIIIHFCPILAFFLIEALVELRKMIVRENKLMYSLGIAQPLGYSYTADLHFKTEGSFQTNFFQNEVQKVLYKLVLIWILLHENVAKTPSMCSYLAIFFQHSVSVPKIKEALINKSFSALCFIEFDQNKRS